MRPSHLLIAIWIAATVGCAGTSPTGPSAAGGATVASSTAVADAHAGAGPGTTSTKPRKVKSGTMTSDASGSGGTMTLSGARFEISGDWSDGGSIGCQPCTTGTSRLWTSAAFAGTRGSATVDGVRYDPVYLSGTIKLSGNVVVPSTATASFTAAFPFTVDESSVLVGYADNPWLGPANELFRLDVRGDGTGSVQLTTIPAFAGPPLYTSSGVRYTF